MSAVCCLVSCSSKIPRFSRSSCARIKATSTAGVILSQSEAQKSAPKTAIFRADSQATSSGVSARPGNRKNGTFGGSAGRAIGCLVVRFEALDDLFLRPFYVHLAQCLGGMRKRMMGDSMPLHDLALDQKGKGLGVAADDEKKSPSRIRPPRRRESLARFARKAHRRR
jgi:hypothetical protein